MADKQLDEAFDKIGRLVKPGSIVVVPESGTTLQVCRVERITPKMLFVESMSTKRSWKKYRYHKQVVCLDGIDETLMYLLTR